MFKFDFGGQDSGPDHGPAEPSAASSWLPAQPYSLDHLAQRAPRISYTKDGLGLPRRDLFDVRYELMSADDIGDDEKILLAGAEDVRTSVYEGGLKVWEGTNDLLDVLARPETRPGPACAELGCGAGLPICFLLHRAVAEGRAGKFVLADYNAAVLRLLTMPNVVLSWLAATGSQLVAAPAGELVISAELVDSMRADLARRGIELLFVAGAWSPEFSAIVGDGQYDLVLASETIYSLDTIHQFTSVLQRALKPGTGLGLVAGKKVYFGVGGGIFEFESLLDQRKMEHEVVFEKGSVGRVVLQVRVP